jgi:hypothetical protein
MHGESEDLDREAARERIATGLTAQGWRRYRLKRLDRTFTLVAIRMISARAFSVAVVRVVRPSGRTGEGARVSVRT